MAIIALTAQAQTTPPADTAKAATYEGPARFGPRGRQADDASDDDAPLSAQRENNVRMLFSAAPRELRREVDALAAAGYRSVSCSYGPTPTSRAFFTGHFWVGRRPPLSPALVAVAQRSSAVDIALPSCPATWGEARALATGRAAVPTLAATAQRAEEVRRRVPLRHVPHVVVTARFDSAATLVESAAEPAAELLAGALDQPDLAPAVRELREQGTSVLRCAYVDPASFVAKEGGGFAAFSPATQSNYTKSSRMTLRFWKGTRLPAGVPAQLLRWTERTDASRSRDGLMNLIDLPLPECPASMGVALALADGSPEAMTSARQAWAANELVGPFPARSAAEDAAALRDIVRILDGLESMRAAPSSRDEDVLAAAKAAKDVVSRELKPLINDVARSALGQAERLPGGAAGRNAFDEWERRLGGPLMNALRRLYVFAARRTFRLEIEGVQLADLIINDDARARHKRAWAQVGAEIGFTRPMYRALMRQYDRALAGQPLLDPAFLARARGDAAAAASARDSSPVAAQTNQAPQPTVQTTVIVFGTPGQIAATQMAMEVGRKAGDATDALGRLRSTYKSADTGIRAARQAFWACYAQRCAQPGPVYWHFAEALREKDQQLFFMPPLAGGLGKNSGLDIGFIHRAMGSGAVDDQVVMGCEAAGERLSEHVSATMTGEREAGLDPARMAARLEAAANSDAYRAYQACRDRMEFILRFR
ncbi:MAG: hypothetical protein U1F52_11965 [Burkholderiales bacterium]